MAQEEHRNEFEQAVQVDMMVNSMIRIAKDLERVIVGIFISAGFLGAIVFILILRWMTGH